MSAHLRVPVTDADHAEGPADAPVVLVEYGDYECPYCGQAFPVVKAVQRALDEAGVPLRFVFRNFPLSEMHPHARHAAVAAESVAAHAGERAFWAMHDALYTHQRALDDRHLAGYAAAVGADAAAVAADVETDAQGERVDADFGGGVRSGVNGTPTFFINGARFDGNWTDAEAFAAALVEAAGR